MDIRQMKVLRAVFSTRSTSAAARMLHISQPAVSKTIKTIEAEIDMLLFERIAGKLVPTSQTVAIMPDVERMLATHDNVNQKVREVRRGQRGTVKIASAAMTSTGLVPEAIARHLRENPNVDFSLFTSTTREVIRTVSDNQADIGICQLDLNDTLIWSRNLGRATVVCAMPLGHPLAALDVVTPSDLISYPLIALDLNEPFLGSRIADTYIREGLYPPSFFASNIGFATLALVRAGLGIALMDSVTAMIDGVTVRPYSPRIDIHVCAIFSRDRPISPIVEAFCDTLALHGSESGLLLN